MCNRLVRRVTEEKGRRRSEKRKSQKKEDPGALKGRKVARHGVFSSVLWLRMSKSARRCGPKRARHDGVIWNPEMAELVNSHTQLAISGKTPLKSAKKGLYNYLQQKIIYAKHKWLSDCITLYLNCYPHVVSLPQIKAGGRHLTRLQNKGTESNFGTVWLGLLLSAKVPVPWSVVDALKTSYVWISTGSCPTVVGGT